MARVALTVTSYASAPGAAKAAVAVPNEDNGDAANDHTFVNDGRTFLELRNSSGVTTRNAEVEFTKTINGQSVTKHAYALAANAHVRLGPWETENYGTTVNVNVDHSDIKLRVSSYA
jgi:hypothetical protein